MAEVSLQVDYISNRKVYVFAKSVKIKCNIADIFNFHLDTNNLPKISPPFPKASIKRISEIPLKEGSTITVSLNFLLFKSDWEILIKKVEPQKLIGDLQIKGVFEYWYHSHIFEVIDDDVLIKDRVYFVPPFGFFGRLLIPFIKLQLKIMFYYRHKKTKLIFEK